MSLKWIIPVAGLVALGSAALPAQAAPTSIGATATVDNAVVQPAHYRRYRHYRHYRHYRYPGVYFYYGHPRHRYWRHHRHWY
jgi:hypothetical protein